MTYTFGAGGEPARRDGQAHVMRAENAPGFIGEIETNHCPYCNRPNPPERWICYFCNTRLSPTRDHATHT